MCLQFITINLRNNFHFCTHSTSVKKPSKIWNEKLKSCFHRMHELHKYTGLNINILFLIVLQTAILISGIWRFPIFSTWCWNITWWIIIQCFKISHWKIILLFLLILKRISDQKLLFFILYMWIVIAVFSTTNEIFSVSPQSINLSFSFPCRRDKDLSSQCSLIYWL